MRTVVTMPPLPGGVEAEVSPLFPWPEDPRAWLRGALLRRGEEGTAVAAEDLETELGWPLSLFEVDVAGERTILALYHFLEWGGAVRVRGSLDDDARARLRQALLGARPDFRIDAAICLAELLP